VKANISSEKLSAFFEVMETINRLVVEKNIYIKDTTTN